MRRCNVVYFVCHDLGRALGCYGARVPTPNLDRFAAESVVFTRAHCASPACSPSRACAMTGRYPHRTGAVGLSHMGWPLDLRWRTSVDDFNAAGYTTVLSGVNHERHPRTDRYQVDLSRHWEDWQAPRAVENAARALSAMGDRPFYLNVATQEPHSCTWPDVGKRIGRFRAPVPGREVWMPDGMLRTPALEEAFERFASSVAWMDAAFGRLIEALRESRLLDRTLVVFTTDHGLAGPRGKGSLYGLGTEIALLMRLPSGELGGSRRDTLLSNLDFRPTLADAAGIPLTDADIDGRSFWSALHSPQKPHVPAIYLQRNFHGEKPLPTDTHFVDLYDPVRALRTPDRLYVRRFDRNARPGDPTADFPLHEPARPPAGDWTDWPKVSPPLPEEELYDLTSDPNEQTDVAPARPAEVQQFREHLRDWMTRTADPLATHPSYRPERPETPGWGPNW